MTVEAAFLALTAALAAVGSALGTAAVNLWAGRHMGLGPLRQELVTTLQQTVQAQATRTAILEAQLAAKNAELAALKLRIEQLETTLNGVLEARRSHRRLPDPIDIPEEDEA